MLRPLARIVAAARGHPGRALALALLVAALAVAGGVGVRHLRAQHHYRQAVAALDRYDFPAAEEHLAVCLETWPDGPATHFLAARLCRHSGHFGRAAEHLRTARRLGHPAEAIETEHLLLRARQHRDRAALAELQARVEAGDPETPAILEVLIQEYIDTYRLRQAAQALDRLLEYRPNHVKALVGRGFVKERLFDHGAAVRDYRAALALDPDNDEAQTKLAEALLITGPAAEAAAAFERLRQRHGDRPAVLLGLARSRRQQGQFEEARGLLDQLLKQKPDYAAALTERGKVALELGHPAEAEPWLRRAVQLAPNDRETRHQLYHCLRAAGRPEAATHFARYQEIDAAMKRLDKVTRDVIAQPAEVKLRCEAAELFLRLGEPAEAVRWLQGALQIDPNHAGAHRALARHYRQTGRPDLAAPHEQAAPP